MALQKQLTEKDIKLANATNEKETSIKLARFNERKEFIRNEIAKIEQEIESILKEEDTMWAEYKQAKEDAKKRKQEYLAEKRIEKEQSKKQTSKENKTKIDKKQTEAKKVNTEEKSKKETSSKSTSKKTQTKETKNSKK